MRIGMWEIGEELPLKIPVARLGLEQEFENWIEADPSFLHHGLTIVGRQVCVKGGIIDLLALDPYGAWVVIEIKTGHLDREVIAQVVDYASCISELPTEELLEIADKYLSSKGGDKHIHALLSERDASDSLEPEEREIRLIVAGTGRSEGLDRIARFLGASDDIQLSVVTFSVFQSENRPPILVREITDPEIETPGPIKRRIMLSVEEICEKADQHGVGSQFREILEVAKSVGLHPRPFKRSIMYTPINRKNVMVFTVQAEGKDDRILLYSGPNYFSEYFDVTEADASKHLGIEEEGWRNLDANGVREFLDGVTKIFEIVEKQSISSI